VDSLRYSSGFSVLATRLTHFIVSTVNSGLITLCTSLAMTARNSTLTVAHWWPNWLISWAMVFTFVYLFAGRIKGYIDRLLER
jgi:hypothetical protein